MDKKRIRKVDYAAEDTGKEKRKLKKQSEIKQQDVFQKSEGFQYQSEGFYTTKLALFRYNWISQWTQEVKNNIDENFISHFRVQITWY